MIYKNEKAFTLIELLAVVVILALTYLFVIPEITSLIKRGQSTNKTITEERIINIAKDYIYNYDDDFYKDFVNVGDVSYISKEDLLNSNLLKEEDIKDLEKFKSVKCELLEDDKLEYTVIYDE
jgi:prepilin-type N-terminal cleavage/methylation domain-containing protein